MAAAVGGREEIVKYFLKNLHCNENIRDIVRLACECNCIILMIFKGVGMSIQLILSDLFLCMHATVEPL